MKTRNFSFELPEKLIAQKPAEKRGQSRLLVYNRSTQSVVHSSVKKLAGHLPPDSLLVFNNSRVRKARIYAEKTTGSRVEFLLLDPLEDGRSWTAMTSKSRKQKPGSRYNFPGGVTGEIIRTEDRLRIVRFAPPISEAYLEEYGHIPLPPYIDREDTAEDSERYQTVYAKNTGSAAAPTAGLHFTQGILSSLETAGFSICEVSLHVGLGTFLPITAGNISDHKMHTEHYEISDDTAAQINSAKKSGRPVVAVGTTSVRTLESAWNGTEIVPGFDNTDIFISPGYHFNVVNHIFTNFHTPESSLLVLVSAFAGREEILSVYEEAVRQEYRFFSYGDAMLIL